MGVGIGMGHDGKLGLPIPLIGQPAKEEDHGKALATLTPGNLTLANHTQDLSGLNADAAKANTQVSPLDIEKLKAKQQSAAALSQLLNEGVGDLSVKLGFAEGSAEKTALHAAVDALVSQLAGGHAGTGAVSGAASELANGVLQEVLKANPDLSESDKAAITQWVATAVGAAVDGQAGAAAALDNVNFNYLNHKELAALIEAQEKCKGGQGDKSACQKAAEINAIDKQRDDYLHHVCSSNGDGDAFVAAVSDLGEALASLYADNTTRDQVKLHWIELSRQSMLADLNDPSESERGMLSIVAGAMLGSGTTAARGVAAAENAEIKAGSAANESRAFWGSWDDYPKIIRNGPNGPQEYAQIGDRLYSQHVVARMQPSGQRYSSGGGARRPEAAPS